MKLAITIKGTVEIEQEDIATIRTAFINGPEEIVKNNYVQMAEKVANVLELNPNDVTVSLDVLDEEEDDEDE